MTELIDNRQAVVMKYFKLLRTYGLNHPTSGNASNVDSITMTGCNADEGLAMVGWDSPFASQDAPIHSTCYKQNGDIGAILHAHLPYTVAVGGRGAFFDLEGNLLRFVVVEADWNTEKPRIAKRLAEHRRILHLDHGVYAAAPSVKEAYEMLCAVEHSARMSYIRRSF